MEYLRGEPLCTDDAWRVECASVVGWCNGKGLDPGAGGRTLYPDMTRVDIRPEHQPDHVGSADALPYPDATFDFVFSSHLLEHLPDPERALREWLRVVKPGGYVAAIIPNTAHTRGFNSDATPHLHEWTPRAFLADVFHWQEDKPWFEQRPDCSWGARVVYFGEALPSWSFAMVLEKQACEQS